MYHFIRKIHLFASLVILAFLGMYFVSGYMMINRPRFVSTNHPPTTRAAALQPYGDLSKEQLAVAAQQQLALNGAIQFPQKQPEGLTRFWINHPGTMVRVDIPDNQTDVLITTVRTNWIGVLVMLHKAHGYGFGPVFNAIALFSDLAGLAMIVFAFSGVYLWWKLVKNHMLGLLCLAASCAYSVALMAYLAWAR